MTGKTLSRIGALLSTLPSQTPWITGGDGRIGSVDAYALVLGDLPDQLVEDAFLGLIREAKFRPSPGEIYQRAREILGGPEDQIEETLARRERERISGIHAGMEEQQRLQELDRRLASGEIPVPDIPRLQVLLASLIDQPQHETPGFSPLSGWQKSLPAGGESTVVIDAEYGESGAAE